MAVSVPGHILRASNAQGAPRPPRGRRLRRRATIQRTKARPASIGRSAAAAADRRRPTRAPAPGRTAAPPNRRPA